MPDIPVVFFDISIGGAPKGRIEIELRSDVVPKTAEVHIDMMIDLSLPLLTHRINRTFDDFVQEKRESVDRESHCITRTLHFTVYVCHIALHLYYSLAF